MTEPLLVPISALNQYAFCPRRCWYMHVAHEFVDNAHTIEGSLLHERADAREATRRGDLLQLRSVYLYSLKYGLTGKADLIEERSGEVYPVEFKKGRRRAGRTARRHPTLQESETNKRTSAAEAEGLTGWGNDQIQLCAQALALEEMLGREIPRGFLYYAATGRRQEVRFTAVLRQATLATIAKVRALMQTGERPPAVYTPKCKGCSLYRICLPREMALIRTTLSSRATNS
jgi:CRISPR-associated exonuclease Cas4